MGIRMAVFGLALIIAISTRLSELSDEFGSVIVLCHRIFGSSSVFGSMLLFMKIYRFFIYRNIF
jgi:hypothetical protein